MITTIKISKSLRRLMESENAFMDAHYEIMDFIDVDPVEAKKALLKMDNVWSKRYISKCDREIERRLL